MKNINRSKNENGPLKPRKAYYKLAYILIGTGVAGFFLLIAGYYLLAYFHPSEWVKEVAQIKTLDKTPVKYRVEFPKSSIYGQKHIGLDSSKLDESQLKTEIELIIINKSKGAISVSNKKFFSGVLLPDKKAIFYKGAIAYMPKQYLEQMPSISNKRSDNEIEIWLFSKEAVTFSSPLQLYIYTYAEFL